MNLFEDMGALKGFGIDIAISVAGFFGAVVSLSFVRGMTRPQILASLVVGLVFANYATPVITYYLGTPEQIRLGAAFFVGLTAMNFIPAILKFSETRNIVSMLRGRFQSKGD
jgi:hypothetical protein